MVTLAKLPVNLKHYPRLCAIQIHVYFTYFTTLLTVTLLFVFYVCTGTNEEETQERPNTGNSLTHTHTSMCQSEWQ